MDKSVLCGFPGASLASFLAIDNLKCLFSFVEMFCVLIFIFYLFFWLRKKHLTEVVAHYSRDDLFIKLQLRSRWEIHPAAEFQLCGFVKQTGLNIKKSKPGVSKKEMRVFRLSTLPLESDFYSL